MFTGVPAGTIFPPFPGTISSDLSAPASPNVAVPRPPLRVPDRVPGFTGSPVYPPSVLLPLTREPPLDALPFELVRLFLRGAAFFSVFSTSAGVDLVLSGATTHPTVFSPDGGAVPLLSSGALTVLKASRRDRFFLPLPTDDLLPSAFVFLQVGGAAPEPVLVAGESAYPGPEQREAPEELLGLPGELLAAVPTRQEDAGVEVPLRRLDVEEDLERRPQAVHVHPGRRHGHDHPVGARRRGAAHPPT